MLFGEKTCETCYFRLSSDVNKNGRRFSYCRRYKQDAHSGLIGVITDINKMLVISGYEENRPIAKVCIDWISAEEQELVNKGW